MNPLKNRKTVVLGALLVSLAAVICVRATSRKDSQFIEPQDLAQILRQPDGEKPLMVQVGFHILYTQGHIPGSEYLGPASKDEGLQQLRQRMKSVPRSAAIVIYCGCCPMAYCPNIEPAEKALREMGFRNVKVLHLADNFAKNWGEKGYPVAKGE
jgi:rhodanese-related sulfurtransferase